jgi:hypothetical protein
LGISTCVKFKGGYPMLTEVELAPGRELTAHIVSSFRKQGIQTYDSTEHEIGNTIKCTIEKRKYEVEVSFDWVTNEWWEVMYTPTLGLITRLFGGNEANEMQLLTKAIAKAIKEIRGIYEIRWYSEFPNNPDKNYTIMPMVI